MSDVHDGGDSSCGSRGSRDGNIAEMTDRQFSASLDALMVGDGWNMPNSDGSQAFAFNTQETTFLAPRPFRDATAANATSPALAAAMPAPVTSISPGVNLMQPPRMSGMTIPSMTSLQFLNQQQQLPQQVTFAPNRPASSSSSVASASDSNSAKTGGKRSRDGNSGFAYASVSEDEGDRGKRRQDRNKREQMRSHQITDQISSLREILSDANVHFKPDKFSTLVTVGQYIKQLQERSQMLDAEHQKLLDTLRATSEVVNNQHMPRQQQQNRGLKSLQETASDGTVSPLDDESMAFISGLDYKSVFLCSPVACAISSIDGRFLDCNRDFEELVGYTRSEMFPSRSTSEVTAESPTKNLSLFNVVKREDMERVFTAMSDILKKPFATETSEADEDLARILNDSWKGPVELSRNGAIPVILHVHLVRGFQGRPKFFNCTLLRKAEASDTHA